LGTGEKLETKFRKFRGRDGVDPKFETLRNRDNLCCRNGKAAVELGDVVVTEKRVGRVQRSDAQICPTGFLGRAYLYANDARREIIILSDENPVDTPPGSNLARLDEVALEDCAAGRYGLHCPPQATAFALGNGDTLLHVDCTATWYVVVLAVWQVCL
jgi:hypothetical protein